MVVITDKSTNQQINIKDQGTHASVERKIAKPTTVRTRIRLAIAYISLRLSGLCTLHI